MPGEAPASEPEPEPTEAPAAEPEAPAEPAEPAEPAGMAQVRKAEQHMRRQLAQERAQLQAELRQQEAVWQAKLEKAEALQRSVADARRDPLAAMAALGFTEADFDGLGRLLYAHSPEGQKDPRNKAAAHQTLAQREHAAMLEKQQSRIEQLEKSLAAREQAAAAQAELDRYARKITQAVGDDTPFVRAAIAKNPERAQARLLAIADRLYMASGPSDDLRDVPSEREVLAAYEAERIAELEEHGIDAKSFHRPHAAAAAPAGNVPKPPPPARPATTLAPSGVSAPTLPKGDTPPSRDAVLAGLAKLRSV